MPTFFKRMLQMIGNEKLLRKWEYIGLEQAYRALYHSLASLGSALIGIIAVAFGASYMIASLIAVASLSITLAGSTILLYRQRRRGLFRDNVSLPAQDKRQMIEFEYEESIRKIEILNVSAEKKEELKIEQFKYHQERLNQLGQRLLDR